jgi:hypothetical protein
MGGIWEWAEETIYSKGMNLFAGTQIKLFGIEKKVISVKRMRIRNKYIQGLRNRNPYFSQEPCYVSTAFKEYVFLLEDNSYVYFDMATEQKDLEFTHIACLNDEFRKFQRRSEPRVVISSNLKTAFGRYICSAYCGFKIKAVNLSDIDGDKIIEDICRRMDKGYELSKKDMLYIVFYPILKSSKNAEERTLEAIQLAAAVKDSEHSLSVLCLIYTFIEYYLKPESIEDIKKILMMTRLRSYIILEQCSN